MKTMQALKRVLAVCLIAVFALQPSSLAVAETASGTGIVSSGTAQKRPAEEITLLRADELPENVSYAEAVEKQFVERMHDEEPNLHTVVLRHADNTRTMIVENHPVKYVDSTGKIQDKSLKIERNPNASKTEYRTKSNDVQTTFAGTLSGGIRLQHDGVDIRMTPYTADSGKVTTSPSAVLSSDSKRITYALSEKVRYDYSLTYMGFKEDIVLTEYTGQTDFVFTLHTNGLHPVQMDGSWFLCDDTEAIRATIGDIIIFTADERNNAFGSLTVETVTANQEYRMTIHVDDDYLTDEKTVYPIRIDPTIEVNSSSGTRAIEDITLNSTALCAPGSASVFVGNRQNYGISRLLMKFPGLNLSNVTQSSNITSATVEIRDLMCESTAMSISVHTFTGNTWSETDSNWSSLADWSKVNPNSYIATPMDTKTVSYSNGTVLTSPHRYAFNILPAVQGWKNGDYNQNKGIIFKCPNTLEGSSTYQTKTFASFNRSAYQPSVKITYLPSIRVEINESEMRTTVGSSFYVDYTADSSVSWSSSNMDIASVDDDGCITIYGCGTVEITATSDDNPAYKDSINVYACGYYAYIKNYFDAGYTVYYGDANESASADKIKSYCDEVVMEFAKLFGLYIYVVNDPQRWTSNIDVLKGTVTLNNIDSDVLGSDSQAIWDDLSTDFPASAHMTVVGWSGHRIKVFLQGDGIDYNRSFSRGSYVLMLTRASWNRSASSKKTLFHEMCHQYGAPDHYCIYEDGVCINQYCVGHDRGFAEETVEEMTHCTMNQLNGYKLCSQCQDIIDTHLSNHRITS